MLFYETDLIYSEFTAPVRKGRNNRYSAGCDEGKSFPFELIVLFYLFLEKLTEELYFKSNAIQYAGDWDGFASSMSSFDTWSGVITSGAGSLVTNSLNLATIGDNGVKVTGFSSMNVSDMRQLNGVIGSLATNGLEYAINGETTFNILNIADFGINALIDKKYGTPNGPKANASVGLLEINIGKNGLKTRLGSGGTNMSVTTVASAVRGFDALNTNIAINHYTNKNDLQNAAIALRSQYGFGGKSEKAQLKSILNGNTILKAGDGAGNAQTVTENGKRIVYLNGYSDNMTKEEQMKLGITLGHEAYRDGVVSDSLTQLLETRNAVAGHTDLMAGMFADDMYKSMMSGIIAGDTNLQMDLFARSLGDDVFNDYVDGMYDSSADYWKFTKDGNIIWDGSKNLYDETGNLLHEYKGDGGNTAALAEGLGISELEAREMLKNAGYTWDGDRHTFVDKNGVDMKNNSTKVVKTSEEIKDFYAKENGVISVLKRKTDTIKSEISQGLHEAQKELSELANSLDPTYRKLDKKYDEVKGKPYADEESYKTMQKYDSNGVPTNDSEGFNCIGFVGYMYGINPKYSVANFDKYEQFGLVPGVDKDDPLKNAKVGDVICLTGTYKGKSDNHAMVYAGNRYVWESTSGSETYGRGVRYQKFKYQYKWYIDNTNDYNIKIYRSK